MPDISDTLTPNSSQLDNIDLRGGPPRIFTVVSVDVRPGTDQPVSVHLAEFDRPWKPGKNMRRVLAFCWGRESDNWPGKRAELFADEKVKFGNETPGGTRISRLSHIDGAKSAPILQSQGKPGTYKVEPLNETKDELLAAYKEAWRLTSDTGARAAIEAEVAKLQGGSKVTTALDAPDPGEVYVPEPDRAESAS